MTEACANPTCPHREQVKVLEGVLTLARQELAELRAKMWGRKRTPPPPADEAWPAPKKRGAPPGHPGWFRKKPTRVHETIEVTLKRCPDCGSRALTEDPEIEEHLQEDIVVPEVKVTRYRRHRYWCRGCGKRVSGVGPDELPGSYIGPQAKALAIWLKYEIKISDRDLRSLFEKLFSLKIVVASIYGFKNQVRRASQPVYEAMKAAVKRSRQVHADETGWRVDGKNAWLWGFVTPLVALSHIDRSRGRKVLEAILGERYGGTLIADFLAVYHKFKAKAKQRCLVHLLRELKKILALTNLDAPTRQWGEALKAFVQRALALRKDWRARRCSQATFWRRRAALARALEDFTIPNPRRPIVQRLAKRVARHKGELLTFLYDLTLDPDNNRAERHLRPHVLFRKLTFGNRSATGVLNHNVLTSILQTAKLHRQEGWPVFHRLLTLPPRQRTLAVVMGRGPRGPCR